MDVLEIARWQFGIVTVYHFLFVPITIGLTLLLAILETVWVRTERPEYLRLTKFFGKLLLRESTSYFAASSSLISMPQPGASLG